MNEISHAHEQVGEVETCFPRQQIGVFIGAPRAPHLAGRFLVVPRPQQPQKT